MIPATATLLVLLAAFGAAPAFAQSVCGVDYYGPCLPAVGVPPGLPQPLNRLEAEASSSRRDPTTPTTITPTSISPFSQNAMDVVALTAGDPFSKAIVRDSTDKALSGDSRVSRKASYEETTRMAPRRVPSSAPRGPVRDRGDAEALAALRDAWRPVAPGSPEDARGVHDGASVFVAGLGGAPVGTGPNPNMFSRLNRMVEGLHQEAAPLSRSSEGLRGSVDRWWDDRPTQAQPVAMDPRSKALRCPNKRRKAASGSTQFFHRGN